MEYLLTFNQPSEEFERLDNAESGPAAMAPWKAYMADMSAAGVLRGGNRLSPPWTATTVRLRDGARQIHDGPFAETKELASGYVLIDVPGLDDALAWALRAPSSATGSTEIRPVASPPR